MNGIIFKIFSGHASEVVITCLHSTDAIAGRSGYTDSNKKAETLKSASLP